MQLHNKRAMGQKLNNVGTKSLKPATRHNVNQIEISGTHQMSPWRHKDGEVQNQCIGLVNQCTDPGSDNAVRFNECPYHQLFPNKFTITITKRGTAKKTSKHAPTIDKSISELFLFHAHSHLM